LFSGSREREGLRRGREERAEVTRGVGEGRKCLAGGESQSVCFEIVFKEGPAKLSSSDACYVVCNEE